MFEYKNNGMIKISEAFTSQEIKPSSKIKDVVINVSKIRYVMPLKNQYYAINLGEGNNFYVSREIYDKLVELWFEV